MSSFSIKISLLIILPYVFCNLTDFEKDRYLTCGEFVNLIRTYDKDEIRQTLTQQDNLFIGVNSLISVDMMINCLHNINDTLVKMMYVNMKRVMNDTEIDDSEIEFIRVNYSDYANITEFFFDDEKANVTITLREVYNEYANLHAPPREDKERKKKDNSTKETLSEDDQEGYEEREIDFSKLNNQKEESKEANAQIKETNNKQENNDKKKDNKKQQENKDKNEDL